MVHQCAYCARTVPQQDYLREMGLSTANMLEVAAAFVEKFASTTEAAVELENWALKLKRTWSRYPVAAPGEREYQSWET